LSLHSYYAGKLDRYSQIGLKQSKKSIYAVIDAYESDYQLLTFDCFKIMTKVVGKKGMSPTNEVGNKDPHMLMTYNVDDSSTLGEVKQLSTGFKSSVIEGPSVYHIFKCLKIRR
jgi:hypothetical protein